MTLSRSSKGFLAVLALLGLGVAVALTFLQTASAPATGGPVTVEIPAGAGAGQVSDILAEQGVIRSALAFRLGTRFDGRASQIQPGTYELTPGMDTAAILDRLTERPPEAPSYRVTIPEGLTVQQTLERLAGAEGSPLTVEALTAALPDVTLPGWVPSTPLPEPVPYPGFTRYEGLLFPDTYEFTVEQDALSVLNELVARTDHVMGEAAPNAEDPYRVLIVASLIEREARLAEERPVISSVIANRLNEGMRLQIDASVLYAASRAGENTVTRDQLDRPSPWNTYTVDTLPPTPISGAGRSAIAAAAAPADTGYRYYVVSDPATGAHAFAATLDEHNRNVAEYRAQQGG
jgi:UPF0755 protein